MGSICCRKEKQEDENLKTISIYVGFFFMVNFVLGTGFLGLPFAFFHGGLIAGACTLLVVGFITWQTALYEVEAMARAQALWDFAHPVDTDSTSQNSAEKKPECKIKITRKFEPSELCEVFVGKWLKVLYLLVLIGYSFLACLSYSTVTGSAWSVNIPLNFGELRQCTDKDFRHHILPDDHECRNAYRFCLMLFAVIVIPISLLDLKEQAIVQFSLGMLRFATLGAIIIFCIFHLIKGGLVDASFSGSFDAPTIGPPNVTDDWDVILNDSVSFISQTEIVKHFNFNGWVVSVPVIVYAYILHQGIPGLTHPVKEKHLLRGYFNLLFITITLLYLLLGTVSSLWFRHTVTETVTLNWAPLTQGHHSVILKILSYYIILFPSIDVCSVYPLVIHTIVNNVYTVVFGRDTSQANGWRLVLVQVSMKFVVAFLPIVIALFVSNLVYVLKYAGLAGFFIVMLFPIVLQLTSQWSYWKKFRSVSDDDNGGVLPGKMQLNLSLQRDSGTGDGSSGGFTDEYSVQKKVNESSPLLGNEKKWRVVDMLREFFLSLRAQEVAYTPYSTLLSHPLVVLGIAVISGGCFVLSVTSLTVHPNSS